MSFIEKEYNGKIVYISDDVDFLRDQEKEDYPVILLINNANRFEDTSFIKFAFEVEDYDPEVYDEDGNYIGEEIKVLSEKEIDDLISEDFLKIAVARSQGIPLVIATTERTIIREISKDDWLALMNLYNDTDVRFLEPFFDNSEEAKEYIERYIEEVYGFYNFGIWGIYSIEDDSFIGLAGFTPRDNKDVAMFDFSKSNGNVAEYYNLGMAKERDVDSEDTDDYKINLELGYAIDKKYRRRGYGFEACSAVIDYALNNIDYNVLFVNVDSDNEAGVALAKKLGLIDQFDNKEWIPTRGTRYNSIPGHYVTKTDKEN